MCWNDALTVLAWSHLVEDFASRSRKGARLVEQGVRSASGRLTEHTQGSRLNPQQQKQIIFLKDIRGTAYLPAENEIKHISLAPHKDQFKMTLKPYYKSPNSESNRRKDGEKTSRSWHRQELSEINSNSIDTNLSH